MIAFRDRMAEQHGFDLITHTNQEGVPITSTRLIMARRAIRTL